MVLIGEKISLKPAQPEDYQLFADWWSDPKYLGNFYNITPRTPQMVQHLIEESKDGGVYFIIDKDTKQPLGTIGYWDPFTMSPAFNGFEIWYQVHQDHRGKGLATQAASMLVNHLFNATSVNRIQATVVVGNDASCRVLEKSGMRKEGVIRGVWFLHGVYRDEHLYSIVRGDWVSDEVYKLKHRF
jgi:ribosomal-protein-alanine N-acetyltransferase